MTPLTEKNFDQLNVGDMLLHHVDEYKAVAIIVEGHADRPNRKNSVVVRFMWANYDFSGPTYILSPGGIAKRWTKIA